MTFKDLEPQINKLRSSDYFFEPQSEEEITAFENKFNTKIPPVYRDFIKTNGGISACVLFSHNDIKVLKDYAYNSFTQLYKEYDLSYQLQTNHFPIGSTDVGDEFIMDIGTNEIYVLLHDEPSEEPLITLEKYYAIFDYPALENWDFVHLVKDQLDSILGWEE